MTSPLRLLGTVGEPINPEAWIWYHEHIGGGRCPVVDTWWQTETGGIMISPLPGITTTKPGSATKPIPGIFADVVDDQGNPVPLVRGATSCSSSRGQRCCAASTVIRALQVHLLEQVPGAYFPGDGARRDEDGDYWLMGRVDDVMNVSGHRLSTTEIESALVDDRRVAEAAVVGREDEVTGEAICCFVILKSGIEPSDDLGEELRQHVARKIGPIARPRQVMFTPDLPKTRSGKIMRRLLRDIAVGRQLGDTTTLADAGVVETIREASRTASEYRGKAR